MTVCAVVLSVVVNVHAVTVAINCNKKVFGLALAKKN